MGGEKCKIPCVTEGQGMEVALVGCEEHQERRLSWTELGAALGSCQEQYKSYGAMSRGMNGYQ